MLKLLLLVLNSSSYLTPAVTNSAAATSKSGNESPPVDTTGDVVPAIEKASNSASVSDSSKGYGDDEEDVARFSDSDDEPSVRFINVESLAVGYVLI